MGIGLVVGVLLGLVATRVFANLPQSVGSFAPVASIAAAALSYGIADVVGGSGFLAVYLVGLAVGSTPSRYRGQLVGFHEDLAFLAQVTMFVVLGLLVFPSDLPPVMVSGFVLALLLVFVIRPVAVVGVDRVQRLHSSRSAPSSAGLGCAARCRSSSARSSSPSRHPRRRRSSTRCSSSCSSRPSSRERPSSAWRPRLGLLDPVIAAKEPPLHVDEAGPLDLVEFDVAADHAIAGAAVRELGLPRSALVASDRPRQPHDRASWEHRDQAAATASTCSSRVTPEPRSTTSSSRWRRRV